LCYSLVCIKPGTFTSSLAPIVCPTLRFSSNVHPGKVRLGTLHFRTDSHVLSVGFHPKGKLLGTVSEDGTFRVWDIAEGKLQTRLSVPERSSDVS